ncbi:MAG: biotin/lipoyl-containing protein, partial [Bradymonadaceae bacterium]
DGELRRFGVDRNEGGYDLIENAAQTRYPVDVVNAAQIVLTSVFEDHVESDVPLAEAMVSPITGIVLDVLVKPGQHVLEGDPVVVVEAMKMENTFRAHQAGTIAEVCVMESQTIFVNDALVHIR